MYQIKTHLIEIDDIYVEMLGYFLISCASVIIMSILVVVVLQVTIFTQTQTMLGYNCRF